MGFSLYNKSSTQKKNIYKHLITNSCCYKLYIQNYSLIINILYFPISILSGKIK